MNLSTFAFEMAGMEGHDCARSAQGVSREKVGLERTADRDDLYRVCRRQV